MVSVTDKVDLADLYKGDRRQRDLVVIGFVNLDPAIFSMGLAGQESPIEFLVTPGAAYDLVNGNNLQAEIMVTFHGQGVAHLVE